MAVDLRVVSGEGRLLPNPNDTMYEYRAHLDLLLDIAYADHMLMKAVHASILAPGLIFFKNPAQFVEGSLGF